MYKQIIMLLAIMSLILVGCSKETAPAPLVPSTPQTPTPVAPAVQPEPITPVVDTVLSEDDSISIGEII